jgi:hypothetical protein
MTWPEVSFQTAPGVIVTEAAYAGEAPATARATAVTAGHRSFLMDDHRTSTVVDISSG